MVTYKLRNPIRNKIFNYKETVQSIKFENGEVSLDQYLCECSGSEFCDPHHQHITTGDLRIVENGKLRSLLAKGPNFREPLSVNYGKCKTAITDAINSLIQQVATKNSLTLGSVEVWKNLILSKVDDKIKFLKSKKLQTYKNPILNQGDVEAYLETLQDRYVIVPIDKASNNFAFVCKRYYVMRLLSEVGIPNGSCETYQITSRDKLLIIDNNVSLCDRYGLEVLEKEN